MSPGWLPPSPRFGTDVVSSFDSGFSRSIQPSFSTEYAHSRPFGMGKIGQQQQGAHYQHAV
jgi:hypothetical protein